MNNIKLKKLNNQIQEEVSIIISREVKHSEIGFVTITGVETASDLSLSKVYFITLNDKNKDQTIEALNNTAAFIRTMLASRIDIRHTPKLTFIYDESIAYGQKIEEKLKEINEQK